MNVYKIIKEFIDAPLNQEVRSEVECYTSSLNLTLPRQIGKTEAVLRAFQETNSILLVPSYIIEKEISKRVRVGLEQYIISPGGDFTMMFRGKKYPKQISFLFSDSVNDTQYIKEVAQMLVFSRLTATDFRIISVN